MSGTAGCPVARPPPKGCTSEESGERCPCPQFILGGKKIRFVCVNCGHREAEHAPCSLTPQYFASIPSHPIHSTGRCSACGLDVGRHHREALPSAPPPSLTVSEAQQLSLRVAAVEGQLANLCVSTSTIVTASTAWSRWHRKREVALQDFLGISPHGSDLPPWFVELRSKAVELTSEADLQAAWNSCMDHTCERLHDTSTKPYLDGLKPDLSLTRAGSFPSALTIEAVIELKSPKAELSPSDRGEVLNYLERVMQVQEARMHVYGALENGKGGVVFRLSRDGLGLFLTYSCTVVKDELDRILYSLLIATSAQLGACDVIVANHEIQVIKPLGVGATCTAYKGLTDKDIVVLKKFAVAKSDYFNTEVDLLRLLAESSVLHVPRVVAVMFPYLVVTPRGHPHQLPTQPREFTADHFDQLLDTLEVVHGLGIVHRDVRPCNFFLIDGAKSLLLNDWGTAAKVDESVAHQGCPGGGAGKVSFRHPAIPLTECYHPFPQQDLYAALVSVCRLRAVSMATLGGAFEQVLGVGVPAEAVYKDLKRMVRSLLVDTVT